jgi:hypothetical protein
LKSITMSFKLWLQRPHAIEVAENEASDKPNNFQSYKVFSLVSTALLPAVKPPKAEDLTQLPETTFLILEKNQEKRKLRGEDVRRATAVYLSAHLMHKKHKFGRI